MHNIRKKSKRLQKANLHLTTREHFSIMKQNYSMSVTKTNKHYYQTKKKQFKLTAVPQLPLQSDSQ